MMAKPPLLKKHLEKEEVKGMDYEMEMDSGCLDSTRNKKLIIKFEARRRV